MKLIISIFILLFSITTTVFSDDLQDLPELEDPDDYYVEIDELDGNQNIVKQSFVKYSALLANGGDPTGEF